METRLIKSLFKLENEHATEAMCKEDCAKDPKCVAVLGGMNGGMKGKENNYIYLDDRHY